MAEDFDYTQCLVFIVCEDSETGQQKLIIFSESSESFTAIVPPARKGYVLLPEVFKNKRPEVLELFRQNDLRILNDQNASSLQLCEGDKLEVYELLLNESPFASPNSPSVTTNDINHYINDEVKRILFPNVTVCMKYEYGSADIRPAVDEHNLITFRRLLFQNAEICCRHNEESLLHLGAKRGMESFVRQMLELGADVDVRRSDGATPLHLAAKDGLCSIVQLLLDHGANIQAQNTEGQTPLHLAINAALPVPFVKLLLRNGANIHIKDNFGHTALFDAIGKGDLNVIKMLLLHGADVNSRSNGGKTPIFYAVRNGDTKLTGILVKFGAEVKIKDNKNKSVLQKAFRWSPTVLQYLLESCFLDFQLLKESQIFEVSSGGLISVKSSSYFSSVKSERCCQVLARHMVKIIALNLYRVIDDVDVSSLWFVSFSTPFKDFKIQCETEVACMKEQTVGDTNLSFYEILTFDSSKVACFLRNNVVAQNTVPKELRDMFPTYGNILIHRFRKGKEKKLMLEEGVKICNFLFCHFKKLPYEIKEKILGYLSFQDFSILKEACGGLKATSTETVEH